MQSGDWNELFVWGIDEINRIFREARVTVSFARSSSQDSANVIVGVSGGSASFNWAGQPYRIEMNPNRLHGKTFKPPPGDGPVAKAFVFLPAEPQMILPRSSRPTGVHVRRLILLHEFVHCTGLSDTDHSVDDIFNGYPDHQIGDTPDGDRVGFMGHDGPVTFPPYFLSASTAAKIQRIW